MVRIDQEMVGADQSKVHRRPGLGAELGRTLWALFFIGSATFNALFTLRQPDVYRAFAQLTFFGWYRDLLLDVAVPHAATISSLVVTLEFGAGVLMLLRGTAVRVGLIGTAAWAVFLCPSMGWYTLWAPLLLVVPLSLLRFDFRRDIVSVVVESMRR